MEGELKNIAQGDWVIINYPETPDIPIPLHPEEIYRIERHLIDMDGFKVNFDVSDGYARVSNIFMPIH